MDTEEFVEIEEGEDDDGEDDDGADIGSFEEHEEDNIPSVKKQTPMNEPEEEYLAHPPSGDAAMKMIETFSNIHKVSNELASMVNVVIKNSRDIIILGEKKSADITEIIKKYELSFKKIQTSIREAQDYFEANKHLAETFNKASDGLDDKFSKLQEDLNEKQEEYMENILLATKKIGDSLSNIGNHINLQPLIEAVNIQINEVMAKSSISTFEKQLERFDNLFCGMNDVVVALIGTKEKKGTLDDFDKSLRTVNLNISKFNKKSRLMAATGFGFGGLFLGLFLGYYIFSSQFNEKMASALIDGAVKQSKEISNNYEEIRKGAEAYEQFRKKYDLKSDAGFGYFDDSGKPYFFYDANRKTTRFKDKIYVGL